MKVLGIRIQSLVRRSENSVAKRVAFHLISSIESETGRRCRFLQLFLEVQTQIGIRPETVDVGAWLARQAHLMIAFSRSPLLFILESSLAHSGRNRRSSSA
jgi:hypothetical protein